MKKIIDFVENRHTNKEIIEMFNTKKITRAECLLLLATENDVFFENFFSGVAEFKLYEDINVDPKYYYTNVPEMLKAFYSIHKMFPNYHVDEMLNEYLYDILKYPGYAYEVLTVIYHHLHLKSKNIATFEIKKLNEILNKCKKIIAENKEYFKTTKRYEATDLNEGFLDVFRKYNEDFKKDLNYDILEENETNKIL